MADVGVAVARALPLIEIAKAVWDAVKGDQALQRKLDEDLRSLDQELKHLRVQMKKEMSRSRHRDHGDPPELILDLQELVYDIEDFKEERSRDRKTSAAARLLRAAFPGDPRREHVDSFAELKNRIKEVMHPADRRISSPLPSPSRPPPPAMPAATPTPPSRRQKNSITSSGSADRCSWCRRPPPPCDGPVVGMKQLMKELLELLLLPAVDGGHEDERKVVSIVGCAGVGKTTLAKALLADSVVQDKFPRLAWVDAPPSVDQVAGVVDGLHQHCQRGLHQGKMKKKRKKASEAGVQQKPHQRYLVVVDGVQQTEQREVLEAILSKLPDNKDGSRVVVTSSIRSVVQDLSPGGYLYTMHGLNRQETKALFRRTLNLKGHPSKAEKGELKALFNKCDGLPVVVVGVANFVRQSGGLADNGTRPCEQVGNYLGKYLAGRDNQEPGFAEARRALAQWWHSLPEHEEKMCLLSLSSFPKLQDDDGIKMKSLLRRWVAEGLVAADVDAARGCWNKLLDLGILSSSMGRNNRCQVHGVMLEYLLHCSVTWNYSTLIQGGAPVCPPASGGSVRRIAIHAGDKDGAIGSAAQLKLDKKLDRVRSLTVCKRNKTSSQRGGRGAPTAPTPLQPMESPLRNFSHGEEEDEEEEEEKEDEGEEEEEEEEEQGENELLLSPNSCSAPGSSRDAGLSEGRRSSSKHLMSLLKSCKLLRVLDLEGCACLVGSDHVRAICRLLHLRYLSLRSTTVAEKLKIPRAIRRLHSLETLDLRDTRVDKLPVEVLMLPRLAHLFGSFELPSSQLKDGSKTATKLEAFFLANKSKLQTLAGFKIIINSSSSSSSGGCHELILRHATMLKKVKIWCCDSDDLASNAPRSENGVLASAMRMRHPLIRFRRICGTGSATRRPTESRHQLVDAVPLAPDGSAFSSFLDGLVKSLKKRITRLKPLHSLSIDIVGGQCSSWYRVLESSLSSIKLRGPMGSLPSAQTLKKLNHVTKLHLCNTGLSINQLSELQSIEVLVYLKLAEDTQGKGSWEGNTFVVNKGGFPSLEQLCFHGPHLPTLVFKPGSMKVLHSLQLICPTGPQSSDLGVTGIADLPALHEVILHPKAPKDKMEALRKEALKHRRMLSIKKQQ